MIALLTSFIGGSAVSGKGVTDTTLNSNTATLTPLTKLVDSTPTPTGNKPKAGINWILFDEQFIPVSMSFSAIAITSDVVYTHQIPDVPVKAKYSVTVQTSPTYSNYKVALYVNDGDISTNILQAMYLPSAPMASSPK